MLTLERLQEVLEYLPDSGVLIWRVSNSHRVRVGDVAGHLHKKWGYIEVRIDGRSYRAHRLAWMLMMGEQWPKQIDHINLCPSDNRWCNLRKATNGQNSANRHVYAKSGFKGVQACGNKWTAHITLNKKSKYLGIFNTPEEAHAAYCRAAIECHGEYARFN